MASDDQTADGSLASGVAPAPAATDAAFEIGDIIAARYRLVRLIAKGGMGEVYEAEDLELRTRVAIKTLRAERIGDPAAAVQLKQEILTARKVTHPNVIRLFDVGFHVLRDARELVFFTMELLDGVSLDEHIRRAGGKLELSAVLAIARQMAAGLDAAHDAGLVHRDFKSPNVILVEERAIVTDFGLARDSAGPSSTMTTMEFVGTPAYMAPEQVTRSRAIGPSADIYAFGVVLYEMVTGTLPFRRETALATAAARIEDEPPSPRVLAPELPTAWVDTILRCLQRDPAKRFRRAGDVVAALTRRPVRWPLVLGAALVLGVAGGAAYVAMNRAAGTRCDAAPLPDIFVDANAAPGGTGSRACPLSTVSDALAIVAAVRTIHVGEGVYDEAHGEHFPLVLRGEVTLSGAGAGRTTIAGVGAWDGKANGGTSSGIAARATIVAGDASARIEIADVSLASGFAEPQRDVFGLMCTRGAAEPNTLVRDVDIGAGYGMGIFVGTEERPRETACNLDLKRSRVHDAGLGMWVVGCGIGGGHARVGVHVNESTFQAIRDTPHPDYPSTGILVWDCLTSLVIENSRFEDSESGVYMVHHNPEPHGTVIFRNNDFKSLAKYGLRFFLAVKADIVANRFVANAGTGLSIYSDGLSASQFVLRENKLIENEVGIELEGLRDAIAGTLSLDAGRADEPGGNQFLCNGTDIAIRATIQNGGRVQLAGNMWNHAPPTMSSTASDGLDLLAPAGSPVDTRDAIADDGACRSRVR